jgi:sulfur-oxidizing protein SoxY
MQMDPQSRLYVPALFVRALKVWQGDALVLFMDGGISISENPSIRFSYRPNGAKSFRAEVVDTNDRVFRGEWPAEDDAPM